MIFEQMVGEAAEPVTQAIHAAGRGGLYPGPFTPDQVDACCRLHRRIRVRTNALRRLLEPDPARDEMMEVVRDLLVEIRGATRPSRRCFGTSDPHRPR